MEFIKLKENAEDFERTFYVRIDAISHILDDGEDTTVYFTDGSVCVEESPEELLRRITDLAIF